MNLVEKFGKKVEINEPRTVLLGVTVTCDNILFHKRIWQHADREKGLITVSSVKDLEMHIEGWRSEGLHAHEKTKCKNRPLITVFADEYYFNV